MMLDDYFDGKIGYFDCKSLLHFFISSEITVYMTNDDCSSLNYHYSKLFIPVGKLNTSFLSMFEGASFSVWSVPPDARTG